MSTIALVLMLSVEIPVTLITVYLFYRILKKKNKTL